MPEHLPMLVFQSLKFVVELVVPGVKDEDLECEGGGGDCEIDKGDSAGYQHSESGDLLFEMPVSMARV
jgi:hypothetical protein